MEQLVGNALRARWHAPGGSGAEATHRFELIEIESLVLGPTHARARVWGFWSSPGATPTMLQTDLLLDRHDHAVSHIRVQAYTADSPDARLTAAFGPAGHTDPNGTRILATSL